MRMTTEQLADLLPRAGIKSKIARHLELLNMIPEEMVKERVLVGHCALGKVADMDYLIDTLISDVAGDRKAEAVTLLVVANQARKFGVPIHYVDDLGFILDPEMSRQRPKYLKE